MKKNLATARMMIRALCLAGVLTKCRRGEMLKQFTAWSTKPEMFDCFAENLMDLAGMCRLSEFMKMSSQKRQRVRWAYAQWKKRPMHTKAELERAHKLVAA